MMKAHLALGTVILLGSMAHAQPGNPGGPPGFTLMKALDTNKDGKISSEEMKNSVESLLTLDKNKDGKLSAEEIGWPPAGGFPAGPPSLRRGRAPGFFAPDAGPRARSPADRRATSGRSFFSAKQLQQLDRNKDGKVAKDEIPRGLQKLILERLDKNKDGAVDKEELEKLLNEPHRKPAGQTRAGGQ